MTAQVSPHEVSEIIEDVIFVYEPLLPGNHLHTPESWGNVRDSVIGVGHLALDAVSCAFGRPGSQVRLVAEATLGFFNISLPNQP